MVSVGSQGQYWWVCLINVMDRKSRLPLQNHPAEMGWQPDKFWFPGIASSPSCEALLLIYLLIHDQPNPSL